MITFPSDYGDIVFETRENSKTDAAVLNEIFVENVYHLHDNMLIDSGVVLDIGANIGAFTIDILLRAKNNGRPVKIIAVEPEASNLMLLKQNLKLNQHLLGESEVIICDKAIGGVSDLAMISSAHGDSRIGEPGEMVQMITLNELFEEYKLDKIDFMKMDIEGSEVPALLRTSSENLDKVKRMAIEYDELNGIEAFGTLIKRFARKCSFYTLGVPSRGCYLYTERHI